MTPIFALVVVAGCWNRGMDGAINFVGLPELLRLEGADLRVDAGQSLEVKVRG